MKVGIAGAGQLGRMLGLAAIPLGIQCEFLDTNAQAPAAQVGRLRIGRLDDAAALRALAVDVDVVTPEIENIGVDGLLTAAEQCPVHPAPAAIAAAQDRCREKQLFASLGIPSAPYVEIDSRDALRAAPNVIGWPILLKTRRLGYDGRGQRLATSLEQLETGWEELGRAPAIAEGWVKFDREVSLIAARGHDGATAFYPLAENIHRDGMLMHTVAPYRQPDLQSLAEKWLARIMSHFDYRGVLAVEFFDTKDGLVANEMAPRVHNSGHWTIEGAETSQFENHLRAITGLPLGDTSPRGHSAMVNLIGNLPDRATLLAEPGLHLHDYGKAPRANRKLGHCTILDSSRARLDSRLERLKSLIEYRKS